jgi:predicted nucleic acid-binding protein
MAYELRRLVTNTTPLITLAVTRGNLDTLQQLFDDVVVQQEVAADGIARLRAHGIWLGAQVQTFALAEEAKFLPQLN